MVRAVLTHLSGARIGATEDSDSAKISLGRRSDNTVVIPERETKVSIRHAEILRTGTTFRIRDLNSTNGTFLNGQKIQDDQLRPGDIIELGLGGPRLRFEVEADQTDEEPKNGGFAKADPLPHILVPPPPAAIEQPTPPKSEPLGRSTVELLIEDGLGRARRVSRGSVGLLILAVFCLVAAMLILFFRSDGKITDFASIAAVNQAAVVLIRCEYLIKDANNNVLGERIGDGTGFAISPDGLIVTNRHVVQAWEYDKDLKDRKLTGQLKRLLVLFADRKQNEAIKAEVYRLSKSSDLDLAIIRVEQFRDLPYVKKLNPDVGQVHQGEPVVLIGFPLGSELLQLTGEQIARTTLTQGVISKIGATFIQIDARAQHGNSGGPVFNAQGEVIAVLTSGLADTSIGGINFATPIKSAVDILEGRN